MTITFYTNYIHHHQIPVGDELFALLGESYHYIAMEQLPDWLVRGGYDPSIERPYIIRAYESDDNMERAKLLFIESDVVFGSSFPEDMLIRRMKKNKLTFRYSERFFKTRPWYRSNLTQWKNYFLSHIRYFNKPLYMLAASAYTANDVYAIGAYRNKVYKWGYFTKVEDFDLEASLDVSRRGRATILWCARFLSWKHPELPVLLAKKLKDDGFEFHLDMIGSGEKFDETVTLAKSLGVDDVVSFLGNMPNDEVLQQMRKHSIFLFTSDKNEGWGAVLNESMSNGCAVVASNLIGSVPFLIHNGYNGLMYKSENIESLSDAVKELLNDDTYCLRISRNAYKTMRDIWSPQKASARFVKLCTSLLNKSDISFEEGPCSKATPYRRD